MDAIDPGRAEDVPVTLLSDDIEPDRKCKGEVGVAGGVMAPLSFLLVLCMSVLSRRRRIGESGGVDTDLEGDRVVSFLDAFVKCSVVQWARSSWSCPAFGVADAELTDLCPTGDTDEGIVML